MTNLPRLLLWTNNTGPYIDAMREAGLGDRVAVETLPLKEQPSDAQLQQTNVLMVPNVRRRPVAEDAEAAWAQALTAASRLAGAARPAAGPDADLRPRHPSRSRCRKTSSARCST